MKAKWERVFGGRVEHLCTQKTVDFGLTGHFPQCGSGYGFVHSVYSGKNFNIKKCKKCLAIEGRLTAGNGEEG